MSTVKIKTTTGKTVEIDNDVFVEKAVELLTATYTENHNVIVWGSASAFRFAIVPYNSKLHSDEN